MDDSFDNIFDRKVEDNSEATTEVETTTEQVTETVEAPVETTVETTEETTQTEAEEPTNEGQPRDEKGRFDSPKNWVPVEAAQAARQKAQAAEQRAQAEAQRAAELEARLREIEAQHRQTNRPDSFENPEGHEQWLLEEAERRAFEKLQASQIQQQREAEFRQHQALHVHMTQNALSHGHSLDTVQEALDYATDIALADEAWAQEVLASPDWVGKVLEERNRHAQQAAEWAEYSRDPAGFIARKAAEMSTAGTAYAGLATTHTAATAKAPRSLASAGTSSVPTAPIPTGTEAFDAIFNKR